MLSRLAFYKFFFDLRIKNACDFLFFVWIFVSMLLAGRLCVASVFCGCRLKVPSHGYGAKGLQSRASAIAMGDSAACVGAARHMVSFRQSAAALARTLPRRSRAFAEVLEVHVALLRPLSSAEGGRGPTAQLHRNAQQQPRLAT